MDDEDTGALVPTRTRDREGAPGGPVRSYSFSGAATNASNFIRMRKMPTVDHILPRATTALSTAFSVGTAKTHHKSMNPFPSRPVKEIDMPYLSYTPTMGRNSQFVDLNDEQRDELGGIEYRSLKLLNKILWGRFSTTSFL